MYQLSRNTEAILLLTAPLLLGQKAAFSRRENLTPALYQQFAKSMVKQSREPYELAELSDSELANICGDIVDILASLFNSLFFVLILIFLT